MDYLSPYTASLRRVAAVAGCLVSVAASALAGCATVRVEGNDGEVRVERQLGLLSVSLAPAQRSMIAQTTGLGVIKAWDGLTLGYYDASLVALAPGDCRLVVWAEQPEQLTELRELIADHKDVCVFPAGDSR